jgi:hypothetical protein
MRLKQIAHTSRAGIGYFATMGIPLLLTGRDVASDTVALARQNQGWTSRGITAVPSLQFPMFI